MQIHFEIRQRVETINRGWLETIYQTSHPRLARIAYEQVKLDNPEEYFELIKITHNEECLHFTPID